MKIVKDGLYMYNDGEAFFIVKADGKTNKYEPTFSGEVVCSQWHFYDEGYYDEGWTKSDFKRLDNKFTAKIEE